MTGPEDLLTSALHERVDHHHVPTTPMSDVVSTAGRIRRNRRIRYAAVTTVVVAVLATPFVIDAARPDESTRGPIDTPPTTTPAPSVRLANVALGDPPAVPWIDGSDYFAADGTRTTLPVDNVLSATPYAGGFLVARYGSDRIRLLNDRLQEVWQRCGQPAFAVSEDRTETAYAVGECGSAQTTLHLGATDGSGEEQTQSMPLELAGPVGILADGVVTSSLDQSPAQFVTFDDAPTGIDSLGRAMGVDPQLGLVSGQLAGGLRAESTGAIVDPRTGTVRWSKSGWNLLAFSPDGSMVAGAQLGGGSSWGIFDAETGDQLHGFALPGDFDVYLMTWEDDEHLLMMTVQGHRQAILRTSLDGAIQRATDAEPYNDRLRQAGLRFAP